jgi:hypothetical protein
MTIEEHKRAVIVRDLPELGLKAGDVGVVVHVHCDTNGKKIGYMLETFSIDGECLDVVSVSLDDVRSAAPTDRMHARAAAQ